MVGMVMQAFTQLSGINVVLMFSSTLLSSIGSIKLVNALVGGVNFLCTILSVYVIKLFGRKPLMVWNGLLMSAAMFGLGAGIYAGVKELGIVCILVFVLAFELSWGPIPWIYTAEILVDKSMSMSTVMNQMTNMLLTFVTPTLYQQITENGSPKHIYKSSYIFFAAGLLSLLGAIFVLIFMKETRNKTAKEIRELFRRYPAPKVSKIAAE